MTKDKSFGRICDVLCVIENQLKDIYADAQDIERAHAEEDYSEELYDFTDALKSFKDQSSEMAGWACELNESIK